MKCTIATACRMNPHPPRKTSDPMDSEEYHGLRASAFGLRRMLKYQW
jgi:hypothetical protein